MMNNETQLREEWEEYTNTMINWDRHDIIADWWIDKMANQLQEIINNLGSNPNEDGSVSPNIQHWIEQKQIELLNLLSRSKISRVRNDGRWHSRGSDWATPQELFDELNKEFHFTLDVCASDWNTKCKKYFDKDIDGLTQQWSGNVCWMNPPYGKVLSDWMEKAFNEACNGTIVVCLVPASTDTMWWHNYAMKGEIRFLRGRPRFQTKEGTWQQTFSPSVIIVLSLKTLCKCQFAKASHFIKVGLNHNKNCPLYV